MDDLLKLIVGLAVFGVIIMIIAIAVGVVLLVVGIKLLTNRKKRMQELQRAGTPYVTAGTVADVRYSQRSTGKGLMLNYYEAALHFTGADGYTHRAFLGIMTPQVMNLQVGMPVQLAVFLNPLIAPSALATDPARGADGMLPPAVEARTWLDRPIDETGTVMLYDDYTAAVEQAEKKNKSNLIVGWALIGIVALRVIGYAISMFASVFQNLTSVNH